MSVRNPNGGDLFEDLAIDDADWDYEYLDERNQKQAVLNMVLNLQVLQKTVQWAAGQPLASRRGL
jgi:hypothetical protein